MAATDWTTARVAQLKDEFGEENVSVFEYSNGDRQVILRGVNRPDYGSVIQYSDGTYETTVNLFN